MVLTTILEPFSIQVLKGGSKKYNSLKKQQKYKKYKNEKKYQKIKMSTEKAEKTKDSKILKNIIQYKGD